jgi:hypothetical protein
VRRIALGAAELSTEGRQDIVERVNELRRKEHLSA